jgi:iron-sulfur cluster assembly accessory protein
MIHISPEAAKQMIALAQERGVSAEGGLRLSVEKGGCAGLSYEMAVGELAVGDEVFAEHGARLLVPGESMSYLDGSTIDYEDGLSGAGFRIRNPRATRNCGCGTSFEPQEEGASAG